MTLALIYARARNYCIGRDGGLPWRLPDEFAFFERTTSGHPIIMGRKTYEDHESALGNRLNIVVSSSRSTFADGVIAVASLDDAIAVAERANALAFVIGGADLLAEAFPHASLVFESVIEADVEGDVFIEAFDFSGWDSEVLLRHDPDDRHAFGFVSRVHRRELQL